MPKKQAAKPQRQSVEFLFLASHGLLSPISAIRWGCNRLTRSDARNLSDEQRDLVSHIHRNARTLTRLFGSMLLLARNEDQTYTMRPEKLELADLLAAEKKEWELHEHGTVHLHCPPGLKAHVDSAILESVLQNLFAVFAEGTDESRKLSIDAEEEADNVRISFTGSLELPFLQSVRTLDRSAETRPVVGGTPGLLLSLAQSLLAFIEGEIAMSETTEGSYTITTRLPKAS